MTGSSGASWRGGSGAADPGPDLGVPRRWPWALLAAVLGAAAGAGAALVVRRSSGRPGAQEPHELRAVVDRSPETQR